MTHFAEYSFTRIPNESTKIEEITAGTHWCNAGLPSWPNVLDMWKRGDLQTIYLCDEHGPEANLWDSVWHKAKAQFPSTLEAKKRAARSRE
jgi:hypothetical protein